MRLAVGRFALVALVAAIGADMAEGMTETSGLGKAHKRAAILTRGADRTVKALSRPAMTRHFRQGRGGERRDRVAIKATAISGSQDEYYDVEEAPHLMEFLADIGRGADTSTSLAQQSPADIQALELDPLPVEGSLLSAETIERVAHLIFLVKIWQDQPRLHHLAQEVAGQLRNVAMYKQLRFVPPFSNVQAVQQEDALFWFWRFRDENLPVPFMTAVRASMSVEIELEELEMEAERMRVQYESGEVTLAGATEYFSELEQFTDSLFYKQFEMQTIEEYAETAPAKDIACRRLWRDFGNVLISDDTSLVDAFPQILQLLNGLRQCDPYGRGVELVEKAFTERSPWTLLYVAEEYFDAHGLRHAADRVRIMGQLAYNLYTLPRPTDMERPWPTDAVLLLSDYDNDSDDTIRSASRTDGDILYMRTAESQWITFLLHTQRAVQQKREAHKWTMQNPRFWGDTPIEAHQSFKRALHRRFPNAKHMFELYRVFAERQALLMSANDPDPETPMSLEDFTLLLRAMRDQLVAGEFCKHARGVMADAMWFKVGVLPKDVVKAVQECHV